MIFNHLISLVVCLISSLGLALATQARAHAAVAGTGTGLYAQYFPNESLSGAPSLERVDAGIDFNWGGAAPHANLPADQFSVRWSGYLEAPVSGGLTLILRSDDGVRVWVDGELLINDWQLRSAHDSPLWLNAEAGRRYAIKIEYFEHFGGASSQLYWQQDGGALNLVPASFLYPDPNPAVTIPSTPNGSGTGLSVTYFPNETLSGSPALSRIDPVVDFNWGDGGPGSSIPSDSFSARWIGQLEARRTGATDLIVRSDDGVRLYLDGERVVDAWVLRGPTDSIYHFQAQAGKRYTVTLEYYEHTGGAVAQLLWQEPGGERQVVPTSQLYPFRPIDSAIQVLVPTESWTSPMFLEGSSILPVTVNGTSANNLGGVRWYADVPLQEGGPTAISIINPTQSTAGVASWKVIDLVQPEISTLQIRLGDAIRVSVPLEGASYALPSGYSTPLAPSATVLVRPAVPGIHRFHKNGQTLLSVEVAGFDVDVTAVHGRYLALQRFKNVALALPAASIPGNIVMEQSLKLTVTKTSLTSVIFRSDSLDRGFFWFRIAGGNRAVLLAVPVQPFDLNVVGETPISASNPTSTNIVLFMKNSAYAATLPPEALRVKISITPYLPDLRLNFERFAHQSTFLGGVSSFSVLTDGSNSSLGEIGFSHFTRGGIEIGEFSYTVYKPRNEVSTCVLLSGSQLLPAFPILTPSANN